MRPGVTDGAEVGPPSRTHEPVGEPAPAVDPSYPSGTAATAPKRARSAQAAAHLNVLLRQLPFAVLLALILAWYLATEPQLAYNSIGFAGAVTAFLATVLAATVPWQKLDGRWSAIIPVLDILAVGLLHGGNVGARYTLVLPVLWMATAHGMTGLVSSVVLGSLAAWSAFLMSPGDLLPQDVETQSLLLLPLMLVATGIYGHLTERLSRARENLWVRQGLLLEEVLSDARTQHDLLQTVLNTINVGVMVLSPEGRVTMTNRAHNTMARGRLKVGDHVVDDVPGTAYCEDRTTVIDREQNPLTRASRGETFQRALVWWDLGGSLRAYRISARPLRPDLGAVGTVVAYQDQTVEIEALGQLEDFVSSVSHELRTPLTAVVGYLELVMEREALPAEVRTDLDVAHRNSEQLLRIVGDLLTAAQTRRTRLEVRREITDLQSIAAEAAQSVRPKAARGGITVRNRVTRPCLVSADRVRIGQAIDNLLSNAVKYSRPGGTVEISLQRTCEGVELQVRDEGIGIAEEDQAQLFTRFFRAGAVRHGPVQGTGLGLHVTHEIISAHGGTIHVSSELGHGTTVTLRLPTTLLEDE